MAAGGAKVTASAKAPRMSSCMPSRTGTKSHSKLSPKNPMASRSPSGRQVITWDTPNDLSSPRLRGDGRAPKQSASLISDTRLR